MSFCTKHFNNLVENYFFPDFLKEGMRVLDVTQSVEQTSPNATENNGRFKG